MSITLKQLYEQTKSQFKLSILAGKSYMNREVSRLYYMEDTRISEWTRNGELIITMLMSYHNETQIMEFIDSFLPYNPPGIMINVGGYIDTIPQSVVEHCEKLQIPLLIFPWEIYLQDIMQTFTNMIFEAQQEEHTISSLFLQALFHYDSSLSIHGFAHNAPYIVAVLDQTGVSDIEYHFLRSELLKSGCNPVFCQNQSMLILVFFECKEADILTILISISEKYSVAFPKSVLHIGIGDVSPDLLHLKQSYDHACISKGLCFSGKNEVKSFKHLGISGLLATSDPALLKHFYTETLEPIITYDQANHSCYADTLKAYILSNGNTAKISESLYIHRNTVNYRLKKMEELFKINLNDFSTISNFQTAFHILYLFEHTNL